MVPPSSPLSNTIPARSSSPGAATSPQARLSSLSPSPTPPQHTTTGTPGPVNLSPPNPAKPTTVLNLINQGLLSKQGFTEALVQSASKASPSQLQVLRQSQPPISAQALSTNTTLLRLQVQGQLLIAHSPLPFKTGQNVLLKLDRQGQLQIQPQEAKHSAPAKDGGAPLNKSQMQSLQAGLRQLIPQQQSQSASLNGLLQLSKQPEAIQKLLLNGTQRHTAQLLLQNLSSLKSLGQTTQLKKAIGNSGVNQEAQLLSLLKGDKEQGPKQQINLANHKTQLARLASHLIQGLQQTGGSKAGFEPITATLAEQLIKLALPQSHTPPPKLDSKLDQALEQLLKPNLGSSQGQEAKPAFNINQFNEQQIQQLRQFFQRLLLRQSLSGLAKIQGQQLQGVFEQLANPSLLNRWTMELPFVFQQQAHVVELDIQEHRQRQPRQDSNNEVQSLWQVRLSLELEATGPLHAEIKLVGQASEVTLWFERKQGLNKAKSILQQLRNNIEAEGIELKGLQCLAGSPPQTGSLLQHNLINTKA